MGTPLRAYTENGCAWGCFHGVDIDDLIFGGEHAAPSER